MTQTDVPTPEKRQQIIDGAAALFASDGYEGASMSRIAEKANVSKGTLYNHFDGKARLFAAWVGQECEGKLSHIFDISEPDGDPKGVLNLLGGRIVRMMMSDAGRVMYRVVLSEAAKFPELAQIFFEAGPSRALGNMSAWLARAAGRGALRVPDPDLAADQFFALCQTRFKLRRELMLIRDPSPTEIDMIVAASVEMFLNTYGA